jgi:hypothetical protein
MINHDRLMNVELQMRASDLSNKIGSRRLSIDQQERSFDLINIYIGYERWSEIWVIGCATSTGETRAVQSIFGVRDPSCASPLSTLSASFF